MTMKVPKAAMASLLSQYLTAFLFQGFSAAVANGFDLLCVFFLMVAPIKNHFMLLTRIRGSINE